MTILRRALDWASQTTMPGQIAYWDLDEISGTTANESIGGFDGTYQNGPVLGQQGAMVDSMATQFDGNNDHVEILHNNAFLLDEGTFAFWFKADNISVNQGLVTKDSSSYDTGGHLRIHLDESKAKFRLQSTTDGYHIASSALSSNTWYHIAVTFGSAGMKIYVNGILEDTHSYAGGMGTTSGGIGNYEPLAIGVDTCTSGDESIVGWSDPLAGLIDEVYAFDRALSQPEILSLMTTPGGAGFSYDVRWDDQP